MSTSAAGLLNGWDPHRRPILGTCSSVSSARMTRLIRQKPLLKGPATGPRRTRCHGVRI